MPSPDCESHSSSWTEFDFPALILFSGLHRTSGPPCHPVLPSPLQRDYPLQSSPALVDQRDREPPHSLLGPSDIHDVGSSGLGLGASCFKPLMALSPSCRELCSTAVLTLPALALPGMFVQYQMEPRPALGWVTFLSGPPPAHWRKLDTVV